MNGGSNPSRGFINSPGRKTVAIPIAGDRSLTMMIIPRRRRNCSFGGNDGGWCSAHIRIYVRREHSAICGCSREVVILQFFRDCHNYQGACASAIHGGNGGTESSMAKRCHNYRSASATD